VPNRIIATPTAITPIEIASRFGLTNVFNGFGADEAKVQL
jgi:hypothetical protein